ncbi:hypothetical protein Lepto7375DRAFT_1459 [Leptolyngbya sp. PCC 7375]|nr:hypothetical protein Lepto7375DRAFT_1459 [Leptolyngbya sp. PCC 7375]
MNTTLTKPIQFAEYLLLPYDGQRTELVDGKIITMTEASPLHIDIIDFLIDLIKAHIAKQSLDFVVRTGVGVEIPRSVGPNNARDPDIVVCQRQQWKAMRDFTKAIFLADNPPALAVEVVSPGNQTVDTVDKRQEYALAGVPEYWIVNPIDGYVLVLTLNDDDYEEVGEYRGKEPIESRLLSKLMVTAEEILDP